MTLNSNSHTFILMCICAPSKVIRDNTRGKHSTLRNCFYWSQICPYIASSKKFWFGSFCNNTKQASFVHYINSVFSNFILSKVNRSNSFMYSQDMIFTFKDIFVTANHHPLPQITFTFRNCSKHLLYMNESFTSHNKPPEADSMLSLSFKESESKWS